MLGGDHTPNIGAEMNTLQERFMSCQTVTALPTDAEHGVIEQIKNDFGHTVGQEVADGREPTRCRCV